MFSSETCFWTKFWVFISSSERKFLFRGTSWIPPEQTNCFVYSVSRGIIFLSEIANPSGDDRNCTFRPGQNKVFSCWSGLALFYPMETEFDLFCDLQCILSKLLYKIHLCWIIAQQILYVLRNQPFQFLNFKILKSFSNIHKRPTTFKFSKELTAGTYNIWAQKRPPPTFNFLPSFNFEWFTPSLSMAKKTKNRCQLIKIYFFPVPNSHTQLNSLGVKNMCEKCSHLGTFEVKSALILSNVCIGSPAVWFGL